MASLQGGSSLFVQGGTGIPLQGSSVNPQKTLSVGKVQPAAPIPQVGSTGATLGVTTSPTVQSVDPAAAAAQAQAAQDAAKAAALRGEITNIANKIKDIFNSRYGLVDQAAKEQIGKLNERFATESGDLNTQITGETQAVGAAHAAGGSYDSSYRGNNVDTVTKAGEAQIRDLGTELQDNIGAVGGWRSQQKAEFDAQKGGINSILAHLSESTDPNELLSLRNTLDGRIAELNAGAASYNTNKQNVASLESIAPSSARAQQLKTTLSQIVAGNADASQKSAIGARLISSAGLTPQEEQELLTAFQGDVQTKDQTA